MTVTSVNPDIIILLHSHVVAPIIFNHRVLQRIYKKMTIKWSFSYNSIVKLSLDNTICL